MNLQEYNILYNTRNARLPRYRIEMVWLKCCFNFVLQFKSKTSTQSAQTDKIYVRGIDSTIGCKFAIGEMNFNLFLEIFATNLRN